MLDERQKSKNHNASKECRLKFQAKTIRAVNLSILNAEIFYQRIHDAFDSIVEN